MLNNTYAKALAEIKVILENSEDDIIKKIPKKFILFVQENYDKNYLCNINPNISINNQTILDETKYLIALIYRSYLCDEVQKKEYDVTLQKNENEYQNNIRAKYDVDIFKNKDIKNYTNLPIVIEKENIFKRIIKKIKLFIKGR